MQSTLFTGLLLSLTTLLVSCGGGGASTTAKTPSSMSVTCDSTTLWAGQPNASGRGIPDNDGTGLSIHWDNQNCLLRNVMSATLDICLSHPRTSDLTWTISTPGSVTALTLMPPADWNTSGSFCDSGQGKLQRIDLLPTVKSTVNARGIWTLNVKDQNLGDAGTLIQWHVLIQGNT